MDKLFLALTVLLVFTACASSTKPESTPGNPGLQIGAKQLFHQGKETQAKGLAIVRHAEEGNGENTRNAKISPVPEYQGISYWIELIGTTGSKRVTASSTFYSGDRIRFHVRTNRPGYLYVVGLGSSGHSAYLFPTEQTESGYIEANREYTVPNQAAVVFDNHPGQEVVWLFLSKQALPVDARSTPTSDSNLCASKDLLILATGDTQPRCGAIGGKAKDILVEDDNASETPAGYAAMPLANLELGALLSLRLALNHQ